mmetsp:Transcript_24755/g.44620  ORF Transcript_24755/g.44620 Transcript_24755/m.44620 type:complete len:537 (+) Transcript_24755:83-1693(+)
MDHFRASTLSSISAISDYHHEIVHLQNHAHRFSRQLDRRRGHQQRLDHVLAVHVGNVSLLDVDAGPNGALRVRLPQLRHNLYGLQPSILRQRVRYDLQRVRVRLEAVRVHARRFQRELPQTQRRLRLGRPAAGDQVPLLHQRANHALGIVDGAIGLGQHQLVRPSEQHRRGASGIGHAHELDHLVPGSGEDDVSHVLGTAKLLGRQGVHVGNRRASQGATDELYVGPLDVRHDQNAHLGQEVQAQFVVGIAKDALLDEHDVGPALLDLFAHVEDVLALVAQDTIHGGVVAHDDVVVHVSLGSGKAELNQSNLGILDLTGPTRRLGGALVEHQAGHELGIIHGPSQLLHHPNVPQIHIDGIAGIVSQYPQHGIHGQRCQQVAVLRHHLRRQAGLHGMNERLAIVHVHRLGRLLEQLGALFGGLVEAGGDHGGVDALAEQSGAGVEEGAGEDDHGGGAVAGLDVLGLGAFHEHLGGGVEDVHFGEDGGAVVGDEDLAGGELHELVHSAGSQGGADGSSNSLGRNDIRNSNILSLASFL